MAPSTGHTYKTVQICMLYITGKRCNNQCGRLHICRAFILGASLYCYSTGQQNDRSCGLSHDILSQHNVAILFQVQELREHLKLERRLVLDRVRKFMRRNRNRCLIPLVCDSRYYEDCAWFPNCNRLHVCFDYIYSNCKAGCHNRAHQVINKTNKILLSEYGFDTIHETEARNGLVYWYDKLKIQKCQNTDDIEEDIDDELYDNNPIQFVNNNFAPLVHTDSAPYSDHEIRKHSSQKYSDAIKYQHPTTKQTKDQPNNDRTPNIEKTASYKPNNKYHPVATDAIKKNTISDRSSRIKSISNSTELLDENEKSDTACAASPMVPSVAPSSRSSSVPDAPPPELCTDYIEGKCATDCRRLHLCRPFILGDACQTKFHKGKQVQCKGNHNIQSRHNIYLLSGVPDINLEWSLKKLTERLRDYLLSARTLASIPLICQDYNAHLCYTGHLHFCTNLHVCEAYVMEKCTGSCRLSHQVTSKDNQHCLTAYGVDYIHEKTTRTFLKKWYNTLGLFMTQETAIADIMDSESNSSCGKIPELCASYLSKTCYSSSTCTRIHNVHGWTFYWQYKKPADQKWRGYEKALMLELEVAFCDSSCHKCQLLIEGQDGEVSFDFMTMAYMNFDYQVRRLSTPSSITCNNQFATKWTWFDMKNEWIHAGLSKKLEKEFLENPKGKCKGVFKGTACILDFEKMVLIEDQYLPVGLCKVRRRPALMKGLTLQKDQSKGPKLTNPDKTASNTANVTTRSLADKGKQKPTAVQPGLLTKQQSSALPVDTVKLNPTPDDVVTAPAKTTTDFRDAALPMVKPRKKKILNTDLLATQNSSVDANKNNIKEDKLKSSEISEKKESSSAATCTGSCESPTVDVCGDVEDDDDCCSNSQMCSKSIKLELCTRFIEGSCCKAENCEYYHHNNSYRWQYDDGKSNSAMAVAFTDSANEDLEKQYCLPQNEGCTVTIKDEVFDVSFTSMNMRRLLSIGSQNITFSIERMSTPSLASMSEGESSEHCTTWIWYWKEGNNDWLQYNVKGRVTSEILEDQYLKLKKNGKFHFMSMEMHEYVFDFNSMTEAKTINRQTIVSKLRRRPLRHGVVKDEIVAAEMICARFLQMSCVSTANCSLTHSNRPFLWQYSDADKMWTDFDDHQNVVIERAYCDLEVNVSVVLDLMEMHRYGVNFSAMQAKSSNGTHTVSIRRLGTPDAEVTESEPSDSLKKYCTIWNWYQNKGHCTPMGWEPAVANGNDMSKIYEKFYHSDSSDTVSIWRDGVLNTVNCKQFTENDSKGRVEYYLCRRPQYSKIHKVQASECYICIPFLRSQCMFGVSCDNFHFKKAYQWQWYDSFDKREWRSFSSATNDDIEKCFNYNKAEISAMHPEETATEATQTFQSHWMTKGHHEPPTGCIQFDTNPMLYVVNNRYHYKVRRLTTPSTTSAGTNERDTFETQWMWYWTAGGSRHVFDVEGMKSNIIEDHYQHDQEGSLEFNLFSKQCKLDYNKMQCTFGGKYTVVVKRRPLYHESIKVSVPVDSPVRIPATWNTPGSTYKETADYKLVTVYSNSTEFAQYNLLFRATMKDDIKRLFRVQNASVWSQYTKKLEVVKRSTFAAIETTVMFHKILHKSYENAICTHGFLCALTAESKHTGNGACSYFSKSASSFMKQNSFLSKLTSVGHQSAFIADVILVNHGVLQHQKKSYFSGQGDHSAYPTHIVLY